MSSSSLELTLGLPLLMYWLFPNLRVWKKRILKYELNADVQLLKEYSIPASNSVKFGDLNGTKRTDLLSSLETIQLMPLIIVARN